MNKSLSFVLLFIVLILSFNNVFAHTLYGQKLAGIQRALEEKPDLLGKSKKEIVIAFGQPVYKEKIPSEQEDKETWIYEPFRLGTQKIFVTFTGELVSDFTYIEK